VDEIEAAPERRSSARPSIAVLPFSLSGDAGVYGAIAQGLPNDIIVELARLRWLFVISRNSSFQFRGAEVDVARVGAALDVRYVLSGAVDVAGDRISVTVELGDVENGAALWGERFRGEIGAVHDIRTRIVRAIVGALELQIPAHEARRAMKTPQNLDAWALYHVGLHHMYQFSKSGNERAASYFERAIAREQDFARAYAGLSFAHFEDAFLRVSDNPSRAAALARRYAEKSIECDALDPFCSLVMGRVSWLEGDLEAALPWLDRAIELNANSAQAKYSRAWTETLLGDGQHGRRNADAAIELSPLDPLLYGMLGVKALSYIVGNDPEQAVIWAERAAHAPRAHPLIDMIAAVAHGLNGDAAAAGAWAESARRRNPRLVSEDFIGAFPFRDPALRSRVLATLQRV
jgi:TolB-like protein